jgi:hypothetical protein
VYLKIKIECNQHFLFYFWHIFTLWEHMFFWKNKFRGWGGDSASWKIFAKILENFAKLWKLQN